MRAWTCICVLAVFLAGCTSREPERRLAPSPAGAAGTPTFDAGRTTASDLAATGAPEPFPKTLAEATQMLEDRDLAALAEILRERVAQREAKMKLSQEQARAAAVYVTELTAQRPRVRQLAASMPHSTIELARAVHERGVTDADADAIAEFHLAFHQAMKFANPTRFDINHSHVIGRTWPEIDYSGERMTWRGQQAYWQPRGVVDFKKAEHIAAYFRHAYALPHFARVYRPRGTLADFTWRRSNAADQRSGRWVRPRR